MNSIASKIDFITKNINNIEYIGIFQSIINKSSLYNKRRLPQPFYVTWNITNRCNLNCIYCANANDYTTDLELNFRDKIRIIDRLAEGGVKYIRLLGGEPSIIENFNSIIDYILKKNIYLSFSSNGIGINSATVETLRKYLPTQYQINISLDSCIKEHNDQNRGADSYNIAIKAIELLNSIYGINLTVFSVITDTTKDDIYKTFEYFNNMGIKGFGATIALKKGRATDKNIVSIDKSLLKSLIKICKLSNSVQGNTKYYFNWGYLDEREIMNVGNSQNIDNEKSDEIFRKKCNCCITRMHIESNGDVYPCDNLKFDEFNLGNLLILNVNDVWNVAKANEIWEVRRNDKINCRTCLHRSCPTGCMGLAYKVFGTIYREDPNCKFAKHNL